MRIPPERTVADVWRDAREEAKRCSESDHSLGVCATCIGSGTRGVLSPAHYAEERRLVELDSKWSEQFRQPNGWTVIPADAERPAEIAAVDNEMRGRVEQFAVLNNPPERLTAYIGTDERGAFVQVWTGLKLGRAAVVGRSSAMGTPLFAYRATIAGREYHGRGQGSGMYINLRETAASKRKRESN